MKKIFALGFFDGVHLGHQALLAQCCRLAREQNAKACAITFAQHPQSLFVKQPPKLINEQEGRIHLMRQFGIGPVFTYPVTKEVMSMPWRTFLDELVECGAAGFVCGYDFRFGYRGEGDSGKVRAYCLEHGLPCAVVSEQTLDGIRVSSTHIRTLLEQGQLEQANRFLGHPHILTGTVVSGRKLGRTIGIPTANLRLPADVVELPHGVYACKATVEGRVYLAVANIGNRPTVGGHHTTVEPWLLDFEGDLYQKYLVLEFHKFLRPEQKFDSLEALKAEIQKNAAQTREYFQNS